MLGLTAYAGFACDFHCLSAGRVLMKCTVNGIVIITDNTSAIS